MCVCVCVCVCVCARVHVCVFQIVILICILVHSIHTRTHARTKHTLFSFLLLFISKHVMGLVFPRCASFLIIMNCPECVVTFFVNRHISVIFTIRFFLCPLLQVPTSAYSASVDAFHMLKVQLTSTHQFAPVHSSLHHYTPLHTSTHHSAPLHTSTHQFPSAHSSEVMYCVFCMQ